MTTSILEQTRQIASDLFNLPLEQVSSHSSPDSIPGWDSIQHLNFSLALEQHFGVQFQPEELEQMLSIELAAMLVEEVLARKNQ